MKKRFKKADIILIAGIAAAGIVVAIILLLTGRSGKQVDVRVAGELVKTFRLTDNVTYEITGADGGTNLLRIENGNAWVEEADCPDGLCKNMGKISMSGQSIVCLPHQVVVEITADEGAAGTDGVDVFVH